MFSLNFGNNRSPFVLMSRTVLSLLCSDPNSYFVLRALAARKMLRERKVRCRRAAREPAIHAHRSKDQRSNSQTADLAAIRYKATNGSYWLSEIASNPRAAIVGASLI